MIKKEGKMNISYKYIVISKFLVVIVRLDV